MLLIRRLYFLLCCFLLSYLIAVGQDFTGFNAGNYQMSGNSINPSLLLNNKTYIDVKLLSAGVFFDNNYLFLSNRRSALLEAIKSSPDYSQFSPGDKDFWDYYGPGHNTVDKRAYATTRLAGPSIAMDFGSYALAFKMEHRSWLSVTNLPYHLAKFAYAGLDYEPQHNIDFQASDIEITMAAAADFSFSYAGLLYQRDKTLITYGASLHYLVPNMGAYMKINDVDYTVPNDSLLIVNNLDAEYGFALPLSYATDEYAKEIGLDLGKGYGLDLGFSFYFLEEKQRRGRLEGDRPCLIPFLDYKLRLGVSITDIGFLRFADNALYHSIDKRSTTWPDVNEVSYNNTFAFTALLGEQFLGPQGRTLQGFDFKMALPTVLNVQADLKIREAFYVSSLLQLPVKTMDTWIRHPRLFYLNPRIETRWFEAGIPLSVYEFDKPRLGFYLRMTYLTVGMDDLSSLLAPYDFESADFYISIHFFLVKGRCGLPRPKWRKPSNSMNSKGSFKRRRIPPCDAYK